MYSVIYIRVILFLIIFIMNSNTKEPPKVETLYASSLYRRNRILEGVPQMETLENVSSLSVCLINCMERKPDCKSFNWGNNECVLMSESICFNETLLLTPKEGYAYYDIMDSPNFEKKHLKNRWCYEDSKCSGRCHPRKPYYFDTPMTRTEAYDACQQLKRELPQPLTYADNLFFANFVKELLNKTPETRNNKNDMKYWYGLTDIEAEGVWMFDSNGPIPETYVNWAIGQPDSGGPYAKSNEDCSAIGEKGLWRVVDVNCDIKLKFFCA